MQALPRSLATAGALVLIVLLGCDKEVAPSGEDNIPAMYVDANGSNPSTTRDTLHNAFPHMLMADGRITLNDRCPVRKAPLNLRLPTLFVNGQAIGFC